SRRPRDRDGRPDRGGGERVSRSWCPGERRAAELNMADNIQRLAASLAHVTGKSDKTAEGPLRFGATTTSDVARSEWHIEGDAEAIVNALGGWLSEFGLSDAENK